MMFTPCKHGRLIPNCSDCWDELCTRLEQSQQNSAMDCGHARSKLQECTACGRKPFEDSRSCPKCRGSRSQCSECERLKAADRLAGQVLEHLPEETGCGRCQADARAYLALRNRDKKKSA